MEKVMQWHPIETAPEGDQGFLVWVNDEQDCWAVYKKDGKWWDHRNGMEVDDWESFTNWMPFPEGPK